MENTKIGPFLILQRLGTNRRQRVYRARQTEQNVDVALKFLGIPDESIRARAIDKIQIEIDLLKELHHPNLVQLLGAGVEGDQIFFASELIKGESLTAALSRRGKFAADQVVDYGRQIAGLLDYLHGQDIIHSKLTPDKILITKSGNIKVADLRLNRSRKRRWDSSRKRELDIAAYMAPEQFTEGATAKSDIYSLGVIMYEMLTGKLPYEPDTLGRMARKKMHDKAPSVSAQVMNCPVWLDKLVCQMILPDPRQRPHSAKAVILALDELKRVDASQTSAVSQVSGAFNPLTAGTDKSEANRLLGKKKREFDPSSFFHSFGFLAAILVVVLAILVYAMWPVSSKSDFEQAQKLMQSDNSNDWIEARDFLKRIIDKGSNDDFYDQAQEMYYESRRRTLVMQAERGREFGLQSPDSKRFVQGVKLQNNGDLESAKVVFADLVQSIDPVGEERHIFDESTSRLEDINHELKMKMDFTYRAAVDQAVSAQTREQMEAAMTELRKIAELLQDDPEAASMKDGIQQWLEDLESRMKEIEAGEPKN